MQGPHHKHSCLSTGKLTPKRIVEKESNFDSSANDKNCVNNGVSSTNNDNYSVSNSRNSKKSTKNLRKSLGCRRRSKDMISHEEQQKVERNDEIRNDDTLDRQQMKRQQHRSSRKSEPKRRLVFTSPRVISSDEDLFPTDHSLYKESNQRWQQISDQAGCHRQDGTVMNIGKSTSTAMAFRTGMTTCAAVRVRSLNLWLDHEKDTLPDWLDMISEVFVNLEHLTLAEDIFPGEDDMAVSARMRRLYVLSILPHLKSIDDMAVTLKEKKLANPNGYSDKNQTDLPEAKSLNNESIKKGVNQQYDDSRVVLVPVSINTDSVGSSKANEIEVEIIATEFGEMKCTNTETTASTTPTNSESTISAIDSNVELIEDDVGAVGNFSNAVLIDSNGRESNDSSDEKKSNDADVKKLQIVPTKHEDEDLAHQLAEDNIESSLCGSTKEAQLEINNCNIPSAISRNKIDIDGADADGDGDQTRKKAVMGRVRTLHNASKNSIELVSVVSNDIEWSLACGVLMFRRDKSCAPKIRLPFSTRDIKKKGLGPDTTTQACQQALTNLRNKEREKETNRLKACTPVQRQSTVIAPTPQVGCCQILKSDTPSYSKFVFPAGDRLPPTINNTASKEKSSEFVVSTNKHFPPSKSLSSPFPMQFRERKKSACATITTQLVVKTFESIDSDSENTVSADDSRESNEMETIASPLAVVSSPVSSPKNAKQKLKKANEGELPPKCPSGGIRRQTTVIHTVKQRTQRRRNRPKLNEASKESARSISMMDLDDEEEFFDVKVENKEVESVEKTNQFVDVLA
eukprot:CAMPEP_0168178582 /NCGR_PEP_ID=MMETSP0139_2-20121125/9242_1 /TAXON_ID=44445 /ORGANISM="Pseudo-nitzschia australis, Strain 10249 10 AB" /LENGTH=798 /DNA_ID=CAMNT_0008098065 /DNA_START=126 /DNA_END=2518 /DNA_ORIENTATION=+